MDVDEWEFAELKKAVAEFKGLADQAY